MAIQADMLTGYSFFQIPPEQKDLQAAVYAGADAYGAHHGRQNVIITNIIKS